MNFRIWSLACILIFISAVSSAQITIDEDGLYHNGNSELYSGTYIEFYTNGNKRIELSIRQGVIDGPVKLYFESGQISEIRSYDHGKMDGTWSTFNQEGIKIGVANYKGNVKHGEWLIWDDAGTLRFEMHYTDGKKTGTWLMYNEEGELVSEETME
jgi:antitoxin component YwqK of YwqJK toxin-antitoxin module